jgi:hypothetical protein
MHYEGLDIYCDVILPGLADIDVVARTRPTSGGVAESGT